MNHRLNYLNKNSIGINVHLICCLPHTPLYMSCTASHSTVSRFLHTHQAILSLNNQLRSMFGATGRAAPFWWKMS